MVVSDIADRPPPVGISQRFTAIDSLRGIAAVGVVFGHIHGTVIADFPMWKSNLWLFVDLFFVLSGFVIASSYGDRLAQGYSIPKYLFLRLGRIYPLHFCIVSIYFILELGLALLHPASQGGRAPFTGVRSLPSLFYVLSLTQTIFIPGQDTWNTVSWSIGVEFWLYVLAALAWHFGGRRGTWFGLSAAFLALILMSIDNFPFAKTYLVDLRGIAGFGIGMTLHVVHKAIRARGGLSHLVATLGEALSVILVGMVMLFRPPFWAVDAVFALTVLSFSFDQGIVSKLLGAWVFRLLGELSYSIYMIHGLILGRIIDMLSALQARLGKHWVDSVLAGSHYLDLPSPYSYFLAVGIIIFIIPMAWVTYHLIEKPAREWSRKCAAAVFRDPRGPVQTPL